jgi:glycosyltransferase involved in cell wall biosynthesis
VLHTEWSSGWGGQEIRILAESKALRERGVTVAIAAQPDGQLLGRALGEGIRVFPARMHKGLDSGAVLRLVTIIRRERIDIVHTHSSVDHRLAGIAARLTGRPIVRSRHLSTPIKRSALSRMLYTRLADRVITSGQFIREAMIRDNGVPPEHVVSIPAGIDVAQFSLARELPDVRAERGIPAEALVVGIVGVLRSWKGHADLVQAVRIARRDVTGIRLLVVGEGPQRRELEGMIRDAGLEETVLLVGHQNDPAPFIKAMDVVVLPSYANEATSQVLPQAMAMRRPVIATDIGGLPEVVVHERTGLVVPPRDSAALAAALLRLHRDPGLRARLVDQGYEHVQRHFTFETMIERTLAVYRAVLGESRHGGARPGAG